jgi:predicted transposase YbfD/YdcC
MNLISVFLVEKGLILAHLGVENKESEMVGVRDLLKQEELIKSLKLTGVGIITMDALHCQKKL